MVHVVKTAGRFGGATMKAVRARNQLRELDDAFRAYVETKLYDLAAEFDLHSGEDKGTFTYSVVKPRSTPIDWSVTIGEIVHNLRSALDHTAYAAAKRPWGKTQFPFFRHRCDWEKKVEPMIKSIPDEVVSVIEHAQPYHSPDPNRHLLAILNHLSNRDKHRLLNTSVITLKESAPWVRRQTWVSAIYSVEVLPGAINNGHKLARVVVGIDEPDPEMEMYGEFTHSVSFSDSSARGRAINEVPVIDVLGPLVTGIPKFISKIELICEPRPTRDVSGT